jgi:hypothetical protein
MRKFTALALAIAFSALLAACGIWGGGRLSGTYVSGGTEITFSRNSFTWTGIHSHLRDTPRNDGSNVAPPPPPIFPPDMTEVERQREMRRIEEERRQEAIEDSINRYRYYEESDEWVLFDEKKEDDGFVRREYRNTRKGKYSITDNEIEFAFSGGNSGTEGREIFVSEFSRTENTITIDGRRFTRK